MRALPSLLLASTLLIGPLDTPVSAQIVPTASFGDELQWRTIEATVGVRYLNGGCWYRASGCVAAIHSGGYDVLTANHVVAGAADFHVELFARKSYPRPDRVFSQVQLTATWPAYDLALIRVQATELPRCILVLSAASPAVDDPLLAVGCGHQRPPYAAPGAFTGRPLIGDDRFQSTCRIVGGFSGGPLVNARGELLGVNVAHSCDGTTYSVSLDRIREFLQREHCVFLGDGRRFPGFLDDREPLIVFGWLVLEIIGLVWRHME